MQTWPKDLVCQPLFTLAAPTINTAGTGDQSALGSHPLCGRGSRACPCPQGQVPPPCFPLLALCPEPRKVGRFCLVSSGEERVEHLPAGMRKSQELSSVWGCPQGRCVLRTHVPGSGWAFVRMPMSVWASGSGWVAVPSPFPNKQPGDFSYLPPAVVRKPGTSPVVNRPSLGSELTPQLCPWDNGVLSAQDGHEGPCHRLVT